MIWCDQKINIFDLLYIRISISFISTGTNMINSRFICRFVFRLAIATYLISHGLHLTEKVDENTELAIKNVHSNLGLSNISVTPRCV